MNAFSVATHSIRQPPRLHLIRLAVHALVNALPAFHSSWTPSNPLKSTPQSALNAFTARSISMGPSASAPAKKQTTSLSRKNYAHTWLHHNLLVALRRTYICSNYQLWCSVLPPGLECRWVSIARINEVKHNPFQLKSSIGQYAYQLPVLPPSVKQTVVTAAGGNRCGLCCLSNQGLLLSFFDLNCFSNT